MKKKVILVAESDEKTEGETLDFKEASDHRARDQFASLLVSFLSLCLVSPRLTADRTACVCRHVPTDIEPRSMKAVLVFWFCLKNLPSGLKMDAHTHATHTRGAAQHSKKKSNDAFRNNEITY